jgi:hypothetical protein
MRLDADERKALMKAVSSCIKRYVAQELQPLLTEVEALKTAQNSLRAEVANLRRGKESSDASVQ